MSGRFSGITNQICVSKTNKTTFAAYADIKPADIESFMEIVSGKIRLTLRDFSSGKGDQAKTARYNIDIWAADMIYEKARMLDDLRDYEYKGTKIYGNRPENSGQFQGMCQTFRLSISKHALMSDGRESTYPWAIWISNGYALANPGTVPGSFYEAKNTFIQTSAVSMRFSTEEFYRLFRAIHIGIMQITSAAGTHLIPEGFKRFEEQKEASRNRLTQNPVQQVTEDSYYAQPYGQTGYGQYAQGY